MRLLPPINDDTCLFLWKEDNKHEWLSDVTVERVVWQGRWQGKKPHVVLRGIPCPFLLDFPDDCTLVVQHAECGPRDKFLENGTFATLQRCKMRRRWIPNLTISEPSRIEVIRVYVSLDCDIMINWDKVREWDVACK
jgi:hypothetical protein